MRARAQLSMSGACTRSLAYRLFGMTCAPSRRAIQRRCAVRQMRKLNQACIGTKEFWEAPLLAPGR